MNDKRAALSDADLAEFRALRTICGCPDRQVYEVGEYFVEAGHPVLPFLAEGIRALVDAGLAAVGDRSPGTGGTRPVVVTLIGRARYEELCDKQGETPYYFLPQRAKNAEPATMNDGALWLVDPDDSLVHLLTAVVDQPAALITACGRGYPYHTTVTESVSPGLSVCPQCQTSAPSLPSPCSALLW